MCGIQKNFSVKSSTHSMMAVVRHSQWFLCVAEFYQVHFRCLQMKRHAIDRLAALHQDVLAALKSLDGSLLLNTLQDNSYAWRFKHPTVRDAFAAVVADNRELLDIYLTGAPVDKLCNEISCGKAHVEGAKVIVPHDRYDFVITRLESFDLIKWYNRSTLHRFLTYRSDREFLLRYITRNPEFISHLNVGAYLYAVSDVDVLVRLHEFGLLPEAERLRHIEAIRELAVDIPDAGFLREDIRPLMTLKN